MNEKNMKSPGPSNSLPARASSLVRGLTPEQTAALIVLMSGGSVIAAAAAGKVHRGTLYRWMQKDSAFNRALERAQDRAPYAAWRKRVTVVGEAVSNVRNAVRSGDVGVSLSVLRGLGLLRRIESGESVISANVETR